VKAAFERNRLTVLAGATTVLFAAAISLAFFYAPKVLGGRDARRAVAGNGARSLDEAIDLAELEWRTFGSDLFMTAKVMIV